MNTKAETVERRTSVDVIFDSLYQEIMTLRLLPGSKISEAEIAAQFGVSRQPVRDAFSRLGNLGFLLVRPQKATEVQKFSFTAIATARFLRSAIETEVVSAAARAWDGRHAAAFADNLTRQDHAAETGDVDEFHQLDYEFHKLLCDSAAVPFAFDAVMENKAQVDRLCVLSMMDTSSITLLVNDHRSIVTSLEKGDVSGAVKAMRVHLLRLDATIDKVKQSHPTYFI